MSIQLRFVEREVYLRGHDGVGHMTTVRILQQRYTITKLTVRGVIGESYTSGYTDWIDVPVEKEELKGEQDE